MAVGASQAELCQKRVGDRFYPHPSSCWRPASTGGCLWGSTELRGLQSAQMNPFQSPAEAGRTPEPSAGVQGGAGASLPSPSPHPLILQVVRAKERLDEELRIQAKDEKEKGWKAET